MVKKRSRKRPVDLSPIVEEVTQRLMDERGYRSTGIGLELVEELVREIVEDIASQMKTKPKPGPIFNRIVRNIHMFEKALSAKLSENLDEIQENQLEFLVYKNPELAGSMAPQIYRKAVEFKRNDILELVRGEWEKKNRKFHLRCPRCGFKSIGPDYKCVVCGYQAEEAELRSYNNLDEKIKDFIKSLSYDALRKLYHTGYLYLGDHFRVPDGETTPDEIVIFLTRKEKEYIKNLLGLIGENRE